MRIAPFAILLFATPLAAQNPGMSASRNVWRTAQGYVIRAAEQMPEEKYAYRPTPEVRSFGQLIGHVAGSQYMFCAAALGDTPRAEDDIEKSKTSKADLVAALKASAAYCEKAYAQTDADGAKSLQMFGNPSTRLEVLTLNAAHDYEHYGNIVTYMRMNRMVPPSSQTAGGK